MIIIECIERIQNIVKSLEAEVKMLEKYYNECDYEMLVSKGEKSIRTVSALYSQYRELSLSLFRMIPSLGRFKDIEKIECESMGISVERLADCEFPAYKITLPILLPNMRRRREDFFNPVTLTVNSLVRRYCRENDIRPFARSMVLFISFCESPHTAIDNDNKEASVILNGLIGNFICDDSATVCDNSYFNRMTDSDPRTEIYIVSREYALELISLIDNDFQ